MSPLDIVKLVLTINEFENSFSTPEVGIVLNESKV